MKFGLRAAVVAGVLLATSVWAATAASAQAGPTGVAIAHSVFDSANPKAAYNSLTAAQRAAFNQAETPASDILLAHSGSTPRAVAAAAASFSGTFWQSDRWGKKALAGNTLYTWWQATKVWISSGRVTKVQVYNYGYETSTPGWRTNGISVKSYNAGWEGRGLVTAKMVLGVAGWDIQHTTNCGQIRLNGDARHYLDSSSCDLN